MRSCHPMCMRVFNYLNRSGFLACFFLLNIHATGNPDSLRHVYRNAVDSLDRLHAGNQLATFLMPSNMDSARKLLIKAAPLANDPGAIRKADYHNAWGLFNWYTGEHEEAIQCFRQTMEMEPTEALKSRMSQAANNMGALYGRHGYPDSAYKYLNIALDLDTERGYKRGITKTLYDLGIFHFRQDQYELALKYLLEVADYQLKEQDTFRLIHAYSVLGNIYNRIDSIRKALEYYYRSAKLASKTEQHKLITLNYNNIASIYCVIPDSLEKAFFYAEKGLQTGEQFQDYSHHLVLLTNVGIAWENKGNPIKALDYFTKAYEFENHSNNRIDINGLHIHMGRVNMNLGNHDTARIYLNKGLQTAESLNSLRNQSEAYFLLSKLDSIQGNMNASFANYKKAVSVRDSIWSNDNRSRIAELQMIYQAEKKEYLIAALKKKEELSRMKYHIGILTIIMICILFLSVILFLHKQRKISKQQLIIRQQEIDKMQAVLAANKQELTGKALSLLKSEEVIRKMKQEIQQMLPKTDQNTSHNLQSLLKILKSNDKNQELWKEFEKRYNELNDGFINKLINHYPDLSPAEIRMCTMLRLQLSSKEIAEISNRSPRTIECIRSNIRKKMGISTSSNLTNHILKI